MRGEMLRCGRGDGLRPASHQAWPKLAREDVRNGSDWDRSSLYL